MNVKYFRWFSFGLILFGLYLFAPAIHAQVVTTPSSTTVVTGRFGLLDPLQGATLPKIVGGIVKYVLGIVGALFMIMFLWGGILWMTAAGTDRVKTAKDTLKYALFGLLIIFAAYSIVSFFIGSFNPLLEPATVVSSTAP